ncbi:MAG: hypothetical protein E6G47_02220 [Actinobacteria bacterium]|nr:MAG: hypothetical protein E6G47_02220 [Actinomycetota bacterium]
MAPRVGRWAVRLVLLVLVSLFLLIWAGSARARASLLPLGQRVQPKALSPLAVPTQLPYPPAGAHHAPKLGQVLAPVTRTLGPTVGQVLAPVTRTLGPTVGQVLAPVTRTLGPTVGQVLAPVTRTLGPTVGQVLAPVTRTLGPTVGQVLAPVTRTLGPTVGQVLAPVTRTLGPTVGSRTLFCGLSVLGEGRPRLSPDRSYPSVR